MNKKLTLAIDCGEKSGLAIYDAQSREITKVLTTDFFGVFTFLKTLERESVNVIVEVPPQFVYARNSGNSGAVRDKMAFQIGGNRREAQLIARGARILGFAVKEVLPVRATKWTAEQLKRETGFSEKTNQHCRDAIRLAVFHSSPVFSK